MRFYKTSPHECSYIKGRQAETVFLDPEIEVSPALYEQLNQVGFRRSGTHIYRPDCHACNQCLSLRILASEFRPARRHRRLWKKTDPILQWSVRPVHYEEAYWQLYARYINARHSSGDMYPPVQEDFYRFLFQRSDYGFLLEARQNNELVLVMVVDQFRTGLSAVYSFFCPDRPDWSLGTVAILQLIRAAQELNMPYVYLGYWLSDVPNMQYKATFAPAEIFHNGKWEPLVESTLT